MPEETISNLVEVRIDGDPLPQDLGRALGACWVESSVNLPGAFHITFRGSALELMPRFSGLLRIGAEIEMFAIASGQGKETPLITGLVTGIETEYRYGTSSTILRGLDHAYKMMRHRRATGYLNQTAPEIVRDLAGKDGIMVTLIDSSESDTRYPLITQPNISDWQFVQYLAEMSGMEADFDRRGVLRFRKLKSEVSVSAAPVGQQNQNPYELQFGANMLRCRTGVTASDQVSDVTSRGWNVDENKLLLGKATALTTTGVTIGTNPGEVTEKFGSGGLTLTETGTPYSTQEQTDRAAKSLAADITSAFAEMEIEVRGQPKLVPGVVVTLAGAGIPFDGEYTVSTTRHVFDDSNGYTTWVWVTGRQVRTLYGLAAGGGEPLPRIDGVVNAIVDDIQDPKEQGRVKLRFPWFADKEQYKTDWVRTVQFGGRGGGGVISYEVDDEVLVAFDRGSMDHPYVLGGLYSNEANNPSHHDTDLQTGGRLNRRSLVSRSGQRLEILDADGETGVRLRTGDEALTVFLEQTSQTITISSKGTVDIEGTGEVSVGSDGQLLLRAPQISIMGERVNIAGSTTIEGTVNITGGLTQEGDAALLGNVTIGAATETFGAVTVNGLFTVDGVTGVPVPVG
jgi:uncharacterized protein involved in type VI secretion and phage assembly